MKMQSFGDEDKLLLRIQSLINSGQKLAILVGSPFTAPDSFNGYGVSTVIDIVQEIEKRFKQDSKINILENDYNTFNTGNKYQVAINTFLQSYGKESLNEIIKNAVLKSRLNSIELDLTDSKNLSRIDNDLDNWYLSKAVDYLGKLISSKFDNFGTILTTNFDPLIEVSLKKNNVNVVSVCLNSDGSFDNIITDSIKVIHLHGYWHGNTLHTVEQLTTNRPKLEGSLINLLSNTTLLVVAYGGWDDVFSKTLIEIIKKNNINAEILWCFYQDNDNVIQENNKGLLSQLFGDVNNSLILYKGINCHTYFKKLYEQLTLNNQKSNLIKQLYDSLNGLDFLNVIDPRYLANEINLHEHLYLINSDSISIKDYRLKSFLKKYETIKSTNNLQSDSNIICNTLISILKKTRGKILNYSKDEEIELGNLLFEDTLIPEIKLVLDFNYYDLIEILKQNKQSLNNAYVLYKLGKFFESFSILSKLSKEAFEKLLYFDYLICEFNLISLKPHLELEYRIHPEILTNYNLNENDLKSRSSFKDIFNLLPIKEQNKYKFFYDFQNLNFATGLHLKVDSFLNEFIEEKRNVEHGGWSMNHNVEESENILKFLWHFINQNYLFVENYNEIKTIFKKLVKGLLVNYSIEVGIERKESRHYIPTYSLNSLEYWFLYILINFLDYKELVDIFNEYRIKKINLDENTKVLLLNAMKNLSKVFPIKPKELNINNEIKIFFFLFAFTDIDNIFLTDILEISTQFTSLIHYRKYVRAFTIFLSSKEKQLTDIKQFNLLSKIIIEVINELKINHISKIDLSQGNYYWILTHIADILSKNEYKIIETDSLDNILGNLFNNSYDDLNFVYTILYHIILPIYEILPLDRQTKIINYCDWLFKLLGNKLQNPSINNMFIDLMFLMLLKNISTIFIQFKNKYLEAIEICFDKLNKRSHPDMEKLEHKLECLGILILQNKILRKECANMKKELIELHGFLNYVINMDNYDYNNFDILWLNKIDENLQIELRKDNQIKSIIIKKLLDAISADFNFSINLEHLNNWIGTL
jgi:hypothetical protein